MKTFVVNLTNISVAPTADESEEIIRNRYENVKHPAVIKGSVVLDDRTQNTAIKIDLDDFCKYVADVMHLTLDDTITQAHVSNASVGEDNTVDIMFASGAGE